MTALALLSISPVTAVKAAPAKPRKIRVVLDSAYVPFSFRSADGRMQGILVDQWAAWEKASGIKAEIVGRDWARALEGMQRGEFDVIDTIFETPERARHFDFTPPYTTVDASIFFREDISGISGIASLKGFPVAVKAGGQHADQLAAAGVVVIPFPNYVEMVEAAKHHKINVFVANTPAGRYLLNKAGIASEFRRSAPIFRNELRRAVRKGDASTLAAVVSGFSAIPPGELKQIDERWYGKPVNSYGRYVIYAGWVAIGALLLIVVLFVWNRMLSRKILQRTAELRESEQRFRQIAENIREIFWLFCTDTGRPLYVSPAYEEICGRSRDRLYQNPGDFFEAIHPEDRIRVIETFERSRESGFDVEYRVLRPDDSVRWIRDRGVPITNEREQVYRLAGIAEDVTERKLAADALQQADARLRVIVDTISTMVWSVRPDGSVDFVNQRWLDYTGLSFSQAMSTPNAPIHADDVPRVMEHWKKDMAMRVASRDEMRLRGADGKYRWFLVNTVPLLDEDGTVLKWYGTSTDIEDRKRAEEKLRQREAQLAEAQRTAHVGSWEWDLRSLTGTWSDECYRIFGVEPGDPDFCERSVAMIHPDDRELVLHCSRSAVKQARPYEFYYRIVRDDGEERILRSIANVVRDGDVPTRLLGATQDVTELKRAEEDLRTMTEQLRALSARIQSTREEEGARIAREIHDELGATLTSLRWEVEGIRKKVTGAGNVLPDVELNRKVTAALGLIDTMILEVRRIASDLRPVVLDVLGVEEAIEWQAQQFQQRTGIPVHCESAGRGADLSSEQATALFRIFQEALTNTLRHARATRVDVRMEEEAGEYVLTIKDNGVGITEDEKARQSSVGLLGMRERATLIGGDVYVAGAGGEGTTVTVRLPIVGA
ncbi:MAG: domain S-box-containing protein [Acidobacteria bacterium]|nr:domain S-box-containing protein [Acidobacteriota bacterium]